jgi:hypothetical protein
MNLGEALRLKLFQPVFVVIECGPPWYWLIKEGTFYGILGNGLNVDGREEWEGNVFLVKEDAQNICSIRNDPMINRYRELSISYVYAPYIPVEALNKSFEIDQKLWSLYNEQRKY